MNGSSDNETIKLGNGAGDQVNSAISPANIKPGCFSMKLTPVVATSVEITSINTGL